MKRRTTSCKGFTMIETLVYLALYAIIMTGLLSAVYSLIESSVHNQTVAMVEEEGNFLAGKIEWALSNAREILAPSSSGSTLSVTTFDGSPITIGLTGGDMRIQEASNPAHILNNTNVSITNLSFTHARASSDGINPESIESSFTIFATTSSGRFLSRAFSTLKYLRK
ncbi:hypothetical protein A3H16_03435 [Candidatus Kaiserbacteria bacterium RIFCSPLOWO2_12_FULL_53_8]|uniref:Prepilin-type N-terminal cleavage/methylation domain-containing protein n=2 Tax=Candidatus Kaiseribacteriota TaxID=1752734 RepID=A0A1F6CV25_9BACT|nr:MAG: hypothetical protein A2851_04355 [Candidatus Kaiserbacteria bacterium RIFCSPHIGHO2_01_FULL_53_29]OGG91508.1 MAG: hypothetical protein A3H16_03435 [Candidatus Kaiserbacteria bacterium RIFCSPLOWO2_12_FULL_53_8]